MATTSNLRAVFLPIKNLVDNLLPQDDSVNYLEDPSVDIVAIAKNCGIDGIRRVPSSEVFGKHAHLIAEMIYVNNEKSKEKERFSIAHELFHLLVRDKNDDGLQAVARQGGAWKIENAGSPEAVDEEIADYFAASLLIPTERFILWEDKPDEEIARAFKVEPKCIEKRRGEIEFELEEMVPEGLSSDVKLEAQSPLSLDELNLLMEEYCGSEGQA
ncbi:MAG: ImmA/IrrE family metallo-endopeptidase [Spirochaetes bacterium]|nr:ImmA/IrrE family metallo-endopeptidase [Spirochaetota bacterium]